MTDSETATRAERLTKLYGPDPGVLDLDFSVAAGKVFGFLGPEIERLATTIATNSWRNVPTEASKG
jgi:ABC-type uncharacterized transport system ATPase subunit